VSGRRPPLKGVIIAPPFPLLVQTRFRTVRLFAWRWCPVKETFDSLSSFDFFHYFSPFGFVFFVIDPSQKCSGFDVNLFSLKFPLPFYVVIHDFCHRPTQRTVFQVTWHVTPKSVRATTPSPSWSTSPPLLSSAHA